MRLPWTNVPFRDPQSSTTHVPLIELQDGVDPRHRRLVDHDVVRQGAADRDAVGLERQHPAFLSVPPLEVRAHANPHAHAPRRRIAQPAGSILTDRSSGRATATHHRDW